MMALWAETGSLIDYVLQVYVLVVTVLLIRVKNTFILSYIIHVYV
jgi:hypothetical protein